MPPSPPSSDPDKPAPHPRDTDPETALPASEARSSASEAPSAAADEAFPAEDPSPPSGGPASNGSDAASTRADTSPKNAALRAVAVCSAGLLGAAILYGLSAGDSFLIPVVLALLIDRLLSPLVRRLQAVGMPAPVRGRRRGRRGARRPPGRFGSGWGLAG